MYYKPYLAFQVSEDIQDREVFGRVRATDRDMPAQITYNSDSFEFLVNPLNGEIMKGRGVMLDFEDG